MISGAVITEVPVRHPVDTVCGADHHHGVGQSRLKVNQVARRPLPDGDRIGKQVVGLPEVQLAGIRSKSGRALAQCDR